MDMQLELVSNERVLAQHAEAIRVLGKRAVRDIIEIGRRLTEAKELAGHGGWLPWLDQEFGWTEMTATRFINVYEMSKSNKLLDFDLPISGLYLLASPSAKEARDAIIERAKDGERLTLSEVKKMIADARKDEKARLEAALAKTRTAYDEQISALKEDLAEALTPAELTKAIEKSVAPLKAKIEKYEKRLQRQVEKSKGPKDEFGVQAAAISGALRRLADSLSISPAQMIEAQKVITRVTGQPLQQGLADDLKYATQVQHWISSFIKSTRRVK